MNPYTILGVKLSDSDEDIKKAYRRLCKEAHPDKGGSEQRMAELNEAYAQIGTPEKRKEYDKKHSYMAEFELYASVLGTPTVARNFGKKPECRTAVNGSDIHLTVNIPFSVFMHGCPMMPVQFERRSICLECDGTGAAKAAKCSQCGGNGRYRDPTTHRFRKCNKCNGTGINIIEKCPYCNNGENRRQINQNLIYRPGMMETRMTGKGNAGHYGGCNGNLIVTFNPELPENCSIADGVLVVDGPEIFPEDLVLGKWVVVQCGDETVRICIPPNSQDTTVETVTADGLKIRVKFRLSPCKSDAERAAYNYLRQLHEKT